MKNLTNCTPIEFLKQTNRIRHSVEKWLKVTDIMNIKNSLPNFVEINDNMSEEERKEKADINKELVREQNKKKLSLILDKCLDEHAEETLELMALMCFVEPEHINEHSAMEYLKEVTEMISNKDVLDFFSSLIRLGQTDLGNISLR